jgi:4-amino-4-deoxy-L-arabinose transferase-like glycosyltransferase
MGEVLQMGRVAETDLLFTFLLSAAVLTWLWGEQRGWRPVLQWALSYSFVALAALAKGPQAPVYFAGTVGLYLLLRGQGRRLLSRDHWIGVASFAGVVAAWQIPFLLLAGWDATLKIWTGDSAARFVNLNLGETLRHLATYPLEVLGCTEPWSLFLAAYLSRRFRRSVAALHPVTLFLTIYVVIGFVPCWITPGGMTRYCLPLYPAVALLIGIVVERAAETALSPRLRWAWSLGWKSFAAAFGSIAVAAIAVTVLPMPAAAKPWAQSLGMCVGFTAAAVIGMRILAGVGPASGAKQLRTGVAVLAALMAATYSGLIVNALVARSNDPRPAIAALKSRLPADTRLVGFNDVHHLFAYHFGSPIELQPLDTADADWFCFNSVGDYRPPLPFEWEEVAVIPVDRNWHARPENVVVVGRRLSPLRAAQRISTGAAHEAPLRAESAATECAPPRGWTP